MGRKLPIAALLALLMTPLSLAGSLTPPGPPAPTMKALDVVEPRTPISSLPFTIDAAGSYYLTANLVYGGSGNAITVNAGPTTIDLNGFTITGSGSGSGIYASFGDVIIRGGTIRTFTYGVRGAFGKKVLIEDLAIDSCHSGVFTGDMIITRSTFFGIGGDSTGIDSLNVVIVRDTRVAGFKTGVQPGPRSLIEDCIIDSNVTGIWLADPGSTVRHTNVVENSGDGIFVDSANNVIADNNVSGNGGVGIDAYLVSGTATSVENNTVFGNLIGIQFLYGGNIITKNKAHANGTAFSIGAGNVAPIDTTGTSTNPWVNFSF